MIGTAAYAITRIAGDEISGRPQDRCQKVWDRASRILDIPRITGCRSAEPAASRRSRERLPQNREIPVLHLFAGCKGTENAIQRLAQSDGGCEETGGWFGFS